MLGQFKFFTSDINLIIHKIVKRIVFFSLYVFSIKGNNALRVGLPQTSHLFYPPNI